MHWYGVKPWEVERFTAAEWLEMLDQLPKPRKER